MGLDQNGAEVDTLTIEWIDAGATPQPAKGKEAWSKKSLRLLRQTLVNVLVDHGRDMRPWANGPIVRAVDLEIVRSEFYRSHPAAEATNPKDKTAAHRQAFKRAIDDAKADNLIGSREIDSVTYVWLINPVPWEEV